MTPTEKFNEAMQSMTDLELITKAKQQLSALCKNFGKSFRMSIPVQPDDTDIIYSEVIKRLETKSKLEYCTPNERAFLDTIINWGAMKINGDIVIPNSDLSPSKTLISQEDFENINFRDLLRLPKKEDL